MLNFRQMTIFLLINQFVSIKKGEKMKPIIRYSTGYYYIPLYTFKVHNGWLYRNAKGLNYLLLYSFIPVFITGMVEKIKWFSFGREYQIVMIPPYDFNLFISIVIGIITANFAHEIGLANAALANGCIFDCGIEIQGFIPKFHIRKGYYDDLCKNKEIQCTLAGIEMNMLFIGISYIFVSFFPGTYFFITGITFIHFLSICQQTYLFDESGELMRAYMIFCDIDSEIYSQKIIKIVSACVFPFQLVLMLRGALFMLGI